MQSGVKFILIAALSLGLMACETNDDKTVDSARTCTDNAAKLAFSDPATAATMAKVCDDNITNSGITSQDALKIQFGAALIENQLMAQIGKAVAAKNTSAGGKDGMASMIPLLTITSPYSGYTASTAAARILSLANAAGNAGMIYVAGIINMAVALQSFAGITPTTDPGTIQSQVSNCAGDATCTAQMAAAFTSTAAAACASPYDNTSTDPTNLCYKSKQILLAAGTNPTDAQLVSAISGYLNTTH